MFLHVSISAPQSPPPQSPPLNPPQSPPLNLCTSISTPQSPPLNPPQFPPLNLCTSISTPQSPPLNPPQFPPLNRHPQSPPLLLQPSTDVWVILDDYTATNDKELSVQKGQQVELLDSAPGGSTEWCLVRVLNGAGDSSSCGVQLEGRVPTTAIKQVTTALTVSSSHGSIDNDGKFCVTLTQS